MTSLVLTALVISSLSDETAYREPASMNSLTWSTCFHVDHVLFLINRFCDRRLQVIYDALDVSSFDCRNKAIIKPSDLNLISMFV